jgi:hypothetical protein
MHKTSIHDSFKENQTETPSSPRTEVRTKIPLKDSKRTQKSLEPREGNRHNHECCHMTRGQILYKIMKKICTQEQGNKEADWMDELPWNPSAIYMNSLDI